MSTFFQYSFLKEFFDQIPTLKRADVEKKKIRKKRKTQQQKNTIKFEVQWQQTSVMTA